MKECSPVTTCLKINNEEMMPTYQSPKLLSVGFMGSYPSLALTIVTIFLLLNLPSTHKLFYFILFGIYH